MHGAVHQYHGHIEPGPGRHPPGDAGGRLGRHGGGGRAGAGEAEGPGGGLDEVGGGPLTEEQQGDRQRLWGGEDRLRGIGCEWRGEGW